MAAAWPVTLAVRLLLLEPIHALCRRACRLGEGCACYWAGRCYYLPDSAARWRSFSFGATLTLLVAVLAPIATSIGIVRGPFSMGGQGSGCGFRFSLPYMADNASRSSVLRQAAAFSGGRRRSSSRRPRASPPPSLPSHRVSLCGQMSGKCRWLGRCSQRDGPDGSSRGVAPLSRCQSRPSTDGRLQELFSSRGAIIQSESHLFEGFTIDDSFIVLGFCVSSAVCIIMDSHHECFNCPCSACPGASCLELSMHAARSTVRKVQYVLGTVICVDQCYRAACAQYSGNIPNTPKHTSELSHHA